MQRSYDVVIIGGGVIGSAIAHFLREDGAPRASVAVIERDPSFATSSSSLSASAIRQQFGTVPNIRMSAFGIGFLREVRERLSVGDDVAEIGLREPGYLILGGPDQWAAVEAKHRVQRAERVAVELLEAHRLARCFPWLNTADLAGGSLGTAAEGWFDGPALHQAFRRKARANGATLLRGAVGRIEPGGPGRIAAVLLEDGERIGCGTLVVAAGARSGEVAALAGVLLPVVPRKRCVFVLDAPDRPADMPFVFDPGGLWVRPEGHLFICGIAPEHENADDDFGLEVDHGLFDALIWPALAHRIPAFDRLRLLRAWAGHYDYNLFDQNAVLGRHPEVPNLIFATGFSGHGMMHAPAAGLGIAELITHGASRTIDLSAFEFERIAAGRPLAEHVY